MGNFSIITGTIFGYNKDMSKVLVQPKSLSPDSYSELQGEKVLPCEYFRKNTEEKYQYKKGDPCVVLCANLPNQDSPFSYSFYLLGVLAGGNFQVSEKYNYKFLEDYQIEIDAYKLIVKKDDKPVVEIAGDQITISQNEKIKIEITEDSIQFDGGENGGVPIAENVAEKIKRIEEDVNNLKDLITSWTPVPNDGGAALKAVLANWFAQKLLPVTSSADLENDKVKH